eukprot:scaffold3330_cov164-Amphora_coffeaeformis.AAC.10
MEEGIYRSKAPRAKRLWRRLMCEFSTHFFSLYSTPTIQYEDKKLAIFGYLHYLQVWSETRSSWILPFSATPTFSAAAEIDKLPFVKHKNQIKVPPHFGTADPTRGTATEKEPPRHGRDTDVLGKEHLQVVRHGSKDSCCSSWGSWRMWSSVNMKLFPAEGPSSWATATETETSLFCARSMFY